MYSELIKRLRETDFSGGCPCEAEPMCKGKDCVIIQAADAIEELVRRETPMRLWLTPSTKRCPSCNKQISGIGNIHGNYRYCRWCGQAIDWSEPPKKGRNADG